MLHLGRPERAWRAFSQWRTSWLSREGVAALAVYAAAFPLAGLLLLLPPGNGFVRLLAALFLLAGRDVAAPRALALLALVGAFAAKELSWRAAGRRGPALTTAA